MNSIEKVLRVGEKFTVLFRSQKLALDLDEGSCACYHSKFFQKVKAKLSKAVMLTEQPELMNITNLVE